MRPGGDEFVMYIEERPEARGEWVELASISASYVGVDLHPGRYFILAEDVLNRREWMGRWFRPTFSGRSLQREWLTTHFWKKLGAVRLLLHWTFWLLIEILISVYKTAKLGEAVFCVRFSWSWYWVARCWLLPESDLTY